MMFSELRQLLGLLSLSLLACLGLNQLASMEPEVPNLTGISPQVSCMEEPDFAPTYQRSENFLVPRDHGYYFASESWLEAKVCAPGELFITASGQEAKDELPVLTVSVNGEVIAAPSFGKERTVKVRIPEAGTVLLAYLNDLYETDARVVVLRDIKLENEGCQEFEVVAHEPSRGANFNTLNRTASLSYDQPITVMPCRSGSLLALMSGRKGNGALPRIEIRQGNRTLYNGPVGEETQELRLEVDARPLTVRLLNPYWKLLGDRNLEVKTLRFVPDARP